jgi:DNA-directed RNA polymerase specialized sigma subunit
MIELNRMIIYTKDIQRITGKSERYGRKIICKIKAKNGKQKHHLVSLAELCEYLGLEIEEVIKYLNDKRRRA